jgi:hypothetical protein
MNIFHLDTDPQVCAKAHCDKHVVKMILEYAQLLSTAHRMLDGKETVRISANGRKMRHWQHPDAMHDRDLFMATHINHPCAVWARERVGNYLWLADLLTQLCREYTHRYGKRHSVESRCLALLQNPPMNINMDGKDWLEPHPFPQAMPEEYKVAGDSVLAYRQYYNGAKSRFAKWKNRETPLWYAPLHTTGA